MGIKRMRAILALFGITTAACSAASVEVEMKEIVYRGGLVKFQIPKDWMEEYGSEGGGMFFGNGPNSGTLRLDVITAESPQKLGANEPVALLEGIKGDEASVIRRLENGNAIASQIIHTSEDGTPITMYWWYVGSFVPPKHVRLANFSYTVLTSHENDEKIEAEVEMVGASIERIEFFPSIGNFSNSEN